MYSPYRPQIEYILFQNRPTAHLRREPPVVKPISEQNYTNKSRIKESDALSSLHIANGFLCGRPSAVIVGDE